MTQAKKGLTLAVLVAFSLSGCANAGGKSDTQALTPSQEKASLRKLGLDEADINYVMAHAPQDAMAVATHKHNLLQDTHLTFDSSSKELKASKIPNIQLDKWNKKYKQQVAKIWGRVAFVVNSPRFVKQFNQETADLDVRTFKGGIDEAVNVPSNYDDFAKVALNRQGLAHNTYKLEAFSNKIGADGKEMSSGGNAWGEMGHPEVFLNPGEISSARLNKNAPLLLHELTHTFGYAHDNNPKANNGKAIQVVYVPNNVPYYVQMITSSGGTNDKDFDSLQQLSKQIHSKNPMLLPVNSGLNTDLFTQYFGQ